MFFLWHYSKRNWLTKGIQHFRSFVEKHKANGVRLFLVEQSGQSPAYMERGIAQLIRTFAEEAGVSVILTAIADPPREGGDQRVARLEGGTIVFIAKSAIALRCRSTTRVVRSELLLPMEGAKQTLGGAAARKEEVLRNLAERPGTEAEGKLAREMLGRLGLPDRPVVAPGSSPFAGSKLVIEQNETVLEDEFYSATTFHGGTEKKYGPLYFLKNCPQPPEIEVRPPPIPSPGS